MYFATEDRDSSCLSSFELFCSVETRSMEVHVEKQTIDNITL